MISQRQKLIALILINLIVIIAASHDRHTTFWSFCQESPREHEDWYFDTFGCYSEHFEYIYELILEHWEVCHKIPCDNAIFNIRDRVAVCLHFLTHQGNIVSSAQHFGMSKASALKFIWEVIEVIVRVLKRRIIYLPDNLRDWNEIRNGFQSIAGFPNVAGAMDGTLIRMERPFSEGSYSVRKFYTSYNVLGVCDHEKKFMMIDVFRGFTSDNTIFSSVREKLERNLPENWHYLGDDGFTLSESVMTPYPEESPSIQEQKYNTLHALTREPIESAFTIMKKRFQILQTPLNFKSEERNVWIVIACAVLHNIYVGLNVPLTDNATDVDLEDHGINLELEDVADVAKIKRDMIKQMIV